MASLCGGPEHRNVRGYVGSNVACVCAGLATVSAVDDKSMRVCLQKAIRGCIFDTVAGCVFVPCVFPWGPSRACVWW